MSGLRNQLIKPGLALFHFTALVKGEPSESSRFILSPTSQKSVTGATCLSGGLCFMKYESPPRFNLFQVVQHCHLMQWSVWFWCCKRLMKPHSQWRKSSACLWDCLCMTQLVSASELITPLFPHFLSVNVSQNWTTKSMKQYTGT